MKRATVHVDLANKSCVITGRRRFHGAWGPDITRSTVEGVIAVDGWRFTTNSAWVMTADGGTRPVERPGAIRRFLEHARDVVPARASDQRLDRLGSAISSASDPLDVLLLGWRDEAEERPLPDFDIPPAIDTVHKGETA